MKQVLAKAWQSPELTGVFSSYNVNMPQLFADVDRTKAMRLGIPVDEIFRTMQIYLGSLYVNDFNQFGRTYQVIAQADKPFRSAPEDILKLQTRNMDGQMVPLGSVVSVTETFGPDTAMRYNAFRSADLNGNAAPGVSSGQAQAAITKILEETLPAGMDFEWTELTYQQILAGNTAIFIFPLCLLLVFLVLAAQYESLTMPLAVIMIVPMSTLSALAGVYLTGGDNNIFTQISLFVLAGLASKNAILIVEFARELERQGRSLVEAAVEASRLRLRPILMTSFAFIMGVVPLVLSSGAGAEMRQSIGHRGVLRHARRDLLRHRPDASVLRAGAQARREPKGPAAGRSPAGRQGLQVGTVAQDGRARARQLDHAGGSASWSGGGSRSRCGCPDNRPDRYGAWAGAPPAAPHRHRCKQG